MDNVRIGVDIGGTKIAVAMIQSNGSILTYKKFPTRVKDGPEAIVDDIVGAIVELKKETQRSVSGIGIGIAGQINQDENIVLFAPNLGWREIPLKTLLSKYVNLPIILVNDVRAATVGEWKFGAGNNCDDFVCLFIGTGIGGGIISGGHLLTGASNSAGELGHMIVSLNGPKCTCGSVGCLEAFASGWALAKNAREKIEKDEQAGKTILQLSEGSIQGIRANHIVEAAKSHDPLAESIIKDALQAITAGCISIVNTFNPQKLIIGGGLGLALPNVLEHVKNGVHRCALKAATSSLTIEKALLGNDAGMIGAASLVKGRSQKSPR
jgi:glucokinase